ncbi:hypothetical protein HYX00_00555 [Candidatus Woesearchaeota archaeon]|nr:hypothetical protein [Candidatus Woesearchaeota archaeon]
MPELEQKTFQKRFVAYKVKISDILNVSLTKDDFSAGYIKLNNANVSRVNIIATVVYKSEDMSYASAVIDDGTGRISLRLFENNNFFSGIDVGDVVLVIGKIREFNSEKYILPEILKKMNNIYWIKVRKLELKDKNIVYSNIKTSDKDLIKESVSDIDQEVYLLIKELDKGDGVLIDEVIRNSNNSNAEGIINKLLENGDIFEITPGKLKVLE